VDPLALFVAGTAYVLSEFIKKGGDDFIGKGYEVVKSAFIRIFSGRTPEEVIGPGGPPTPPPNPDELRELNQELLQRWPMLARAQRAVPVLSQKSVLWVDDVPDNNKYEALALRTFGVHVDQTPSSEGALAKLEARPYDLILSDIERDGLEDAGIRFLKQLRAEGNQTPVVFYIGKVDRSRGVPPGAFGIADMPEPLFHLVLDVLAPVQPKLLVVRGEKCNAEFLIRQGDNYVGRAGEAPVDIDLADQEPPDRVWCSHQHAQITFDGSRMFIEDLNSTNGTYLNREKVYSGSDHRKPLNVNDIIQIGNVQLKVMQW
jgi:CheY-like chemotaxis protein